MPGASLHLCVLVRAYVAQLSGLVSLLASLQAAANEPCLRGENDTKPARAFSVAAHVFSTDVTVAAPHPGQHINITVTDEEGAAEAESTRRAVLELASSPLLSKNRDRFAVFAHPHVHADELRRYWRSRCIRNDGSLKGDAMMYDFGYNQADLALAAVCCTPRLAHTEHDHARTTHANLPVCMSVQHSSHCARILCVRAVQVLQRTQPRACDYVLVTNGDNLCAPAPQSSHAVPIAAHESLYRHWICAQSLFSPYFTTQCRTHTACVALTQVCALIHPAHVPVHAPRPRSDRLVVLFPLPVGQSLRPEPHCGPSRAQLAGTDAASARLLRPWRRDGERRPAATALECLATGLQPFRRLSRMAFGGWAARRPPGQARAAQRQGA